MKTFKDIEIGDDLWYFDSYEEKVISCKVTHIEYVGNSYVFGLSTGKTLITKPSVSRNQGFFISKSELVQEIEAEMSENYDKTWEELMILYEKALGFKETLDKFRNNEGL